MVNNYRNYHNYLVIIKNNSKRIKKYKNWINSDHINNYSWRTYYTLFTPKKLNISLDRVYTETSKEKNNYSLLYDESNKINLNDINSSIGLVLSNKNLLN